MVDGSRPLGIPTATSDRLGDWWVFFLAFVLAGYAFMGKGFASAGFPPLYVGEMAYLSGVVMLLRSRCIIASLASLPSVLLAANMAWVLLRTLPFMKAYGVDALRDSAVIMYGGFAFIIVALLLDDCRRIETIVAYYSRLAAAFVPAIPFLFAISEYLHEYIPDLLGVNAPFLEIRSGEAAVHLAGASVFALAGFYRIGWRSILAICAAMVMAASHGRGAMFAFSVPVILAAIFVGKTFAVARTVVLVSTVAFVAMIVGSSIREYHSPTSAAERSVGPQQIVDNLISTFSDSGNEEAEATKAWRLEWWNIIVTDTVFGSNFWTGRGFGLNLADADGFQVGDQPDRPALRSPHSVHMTILARAGVPGLALWFAFLLSWFGMMFRCLRAAQRSGQVEWSRLFLFIGCYVLSIIIDASFDVAIEGPMIGIWFWCLVGFGIGTGMIFRATPPRSEGHHHVVDSIG
jgi:hypothetical protein